MISKPKRGMDVLAWCAALYDELLPLFKAKASGGLTLRKGSPAWIIGGQPAKTTRTPWEVYVSPDAEGSAAWRTVRVHNGTVDGFHPRSADDESFSDDTDVDENGEAKAPEMDMGLAPNTTYSLVLEMRRHTQDENGANAWDPFQPFIYFSSESPAFSGQFALNGGEVPDIYRNVYFRTIATVKVGSQDDEEAEDYRKLTITQILTDHITTCFVKPTIWEPVVTVEYAHEPDPTEWRMVKIFAPGIVSGPQQMGITNIEDWQTLEAGSWRYLWLEFTIDADSGETTYVTLKAGNTLPTVEAPEPGKAPTKGYYLLATINVPSNLGKLSIVMNVSHPLLNYQASEIGWALNNDNELCQLYTAIFWEG